MRVLELFRLNASFLARSRVKDIGKIEFPYSRLLFVGLPTKYERGSLRIIVVVRFNIEISHS